MFHEVKVDKVTACHKINNPASGRVMQKAGIHYDTTLKGYRVDKEMGKRVDLRHKAPPFRIQ